MTARQFSGLSVACAALLLGAASVSQAQGLGDIAGATMPQFVSIKIGSGASASTVSQLTVPLVAVVPITSRFNIDVATSYASSTVARSGKPNSEISGLTDTQVRANLTLGNDAVVLTVGANLATGQYQIDTSKALAAGQIGNDFLIFPTSSYGSGNSATAGVAVAQTFGGWNVGIATSFRKSTAFDAYQAVTNTGLASLRFTPADEVRARLGADRLIGDGRLAIGVTYSSFGKDVLDNTSYATGDRYIGQASLALPVNGADLYVSSWALYRAKGQQLGGVSNPETVLDGAVSLGFHQGDLLIEPTLEGRNWTVDGIKAGLLGNVGVRLRWSSGAVMVMPTVTYQMGKLYDTGDGSSVNATGYRLALTVRVH